jgi:hypothetical protein
LNDNVIDLQIKRTVLETASLTRGGAAAAPAAPASTSSLVTSTSLSQQTRKEGNEQGDSQEKEEKKGPVEEVKINALAPHNTSPVYAFSCMFYTKLTENRRGGTVSRMVNDYFCLFMFISS